MKSVIINSASEVMGTVDEIVDRVEKRINMTMLPMRKTAFEKFPVLFTLLVTLGLVATMRGLDLLLSKLPTLYNNPLLLLLIGLGILIATGTIYKKLG